MKERVAGLLGESVEGMPWLGTFHAICVKLLRRHAELVDLKSTFTILDTDDQVRLLKQLIVAANIDENIISKVNVPIYNLAAREDHIAPLPSVFKQGDFFGGETELVVAGSGHIAGVINPPESGKYQYWTNKKGARTLDDWLAGAEEHPCSWWPHWKDWVKEKSGKKVPARDPELGALQPIEPAPGSYVKVKS